MKANSIRVVLGGLILTIGTTSSLGGTATVTAVSPSTLALDSNPNNLTIGDSANNTVASNDGVTLAQFRSNLTAAGTSGGFLDFQEQYQGGSWPNQGAANNGILLGDSSANAITVNAPGTTTPIFSFFRNESAGNGIDANDGGENGQVISGGYKDATGAGGNVGTVDFSTSPPTPDQSSANSGSVDGGYLGIVNSSGDNNLPLVFTPATGQPGLVAFGITALSRGSSRATQIVLTLSDGHTTITGTSDTVSGAPIFYGFQLSAAQIAAGLTIVDATIDNPNGLNRFDDLAYITAPAPEPASFGLISLAGLALLRRRQSAKHRR